MTESEETPAEKRERQAEAAKTPHPYVPQGVPGWRTCGLCGIGANAKIHRG